MPGTSDPLRWDDGVEPSASSGPVARWEIDDSFVELGQMERWILATVRRRGTIGFVATMTLAVILASVTLTTLGMRYLVGEATREVLWSVMVFAAVVPAIVAPPTLYSSVRLTDRLDRAGTSLRLAALTDPLTGVLNRRGFFDEVERSRQLESVFDVSMIDVDRFKPLNDKHGHAAGDLVLARVADWLTEMAGETGLVARMGGDEFALVVPAEDRQNLPGRQRLVMDGLAFSVTIGTAVLPPGEDIDVALARADEVLYASKASRA